MRVSQSRPVHSLTLIHSLFFLDRFFSCVPTATSQVFLTQVYSATGSAEPLPAFLLPQYIIMFFSMTILTAYTLSMLF